jgi:hypothetical protein
MKTQTLSASLTILFGAGVDQTGLLIQGLVGFNDVSADWGVDIGSSLDRLNSTNLL